MSEKRRVRIAELSRALMAAQTPIRVLRTLDWPQEVQQRFFAAGCRSLPEVTYAVRPEVPAALQTLEDLARSLDPLDPAEAWLQATAESFAGAGRMLLAAGTRDFGRRSREVYGAPTDPTHDPRVTNLDLARHVVGFVEGYRDRALGPAGEPLFTAREVAEELERRFARFFGADAPKVTVVSRLSARAVAGADTVRIRDGATFTPAELTRLEHHEGYVHVATTLNGKRQPVLGALGIASPRATAQQEGLATFAELQAQALDLDRLEILADRVLGIQMALDGADFLDLFVYFLDHAGSREEAYQAARRVFRGGPVDGGAPFTKDACYLEGLLLTANFIQAALARHRPEYVRFLFAGKVHTDDLPLLMQLHEEGLLEAPRYMPHWASDLRFIAAQMGFSAFIHHRTDAEAWFSYCDRLFDAAAAARAVAEHARDPA